MEERNEEYQEHQHQDSKLKNFKRDDLLLIGGLVWIIFGSLLIYLGYTKMLVSGQSILLYFLIAVAVFYVAFVYIFKKLAEKYTERIRSKKEDNVPVWKVFNIEGYLVITVLIIGGFYIGSLDALNPIWWAPAYIGLGLALVVSGILYWIGYAKEKMKFKKKKK